MVWLHVQFPSIQGVRIDKLDINPTLNLEMFGAGGLMNIRYGANMLAGMVVMWLIVVPGIVPPDHLSRLEQVQTWDEWDPDTERYPYDWRDFTEGGGS